MLGETAAAVRRVGFVLAFVAGAAIVDSPGVAAGSASVPANVGDSLIAELVAWIGDHTKYNVTTALESPPSVTLCAKGTTIQYEDREVTIAPEGLLRALYDAKQRRIHLVRPWNAADMRDRSSLLHELVHDVQYSSRDWACKEEPEWEAYKLQDAWLTENGVRSGFNWTHVYLLSRCRRDTHL